MVRHFVGFSQSLKPLTNLYILELRSLSFFPLVLFLIWTRGREFGRESEREHLWTDAANGSENELWLRTKARNETAL